MRKVKEELTKKTKQKILDALEDKEEKEYIVSFNDVFVEAKNEIEAEQKARRLIKDGEVSINFIEEN